MELIERDLILSLDDIRALHAGEVLPIPPGATVLVSEVYLRTTDEMEGEEWERERDRFTRFPRGDRHDPAGD